MPNHQKFLAHRLFSGELDSRHPTLATGAPAPPAAGRLSRGAQMQLGSSQGGASPSRAEAPTAPRAGSGMKDSRAPEEARSPPHRRAAKGAGAHASLASPGFASPGSQPGSQPDSQPSRERTGSTRGGAAASSAMFQGEGGTAVRLEPSAQARVEKRQLPRQMTQACMPPQSERTARGEKRARAAADEHGSPPAAHRSPARDGDEAQIDTPAAGAKRAGRPAGVAAEGGAHSQVAPPRKRAHDDDTHRAGAGSQRRARDEQVVVSMSPTPKRTAAAAAQFAHSGADRRETAGAGEKGRTERGAAATGGARGASDAARDSGDAESDDDDEATPGLVDDEVDVYEGQPADAPAEPVPEPAAAGRAPSHSATRVAPMATSARGKEEELGRQERRARRGDEATLEPSTLPEPEPQPRVKPHCRAPSGKEWDAVSGAWADKKGPHTGPRVSVRPQPQPVVRAVQPEADAHEGKTTDAAAGGTPSHSATRAARVAAPTRGEKEELGRQERRSRRGDEATLEPSTLPEPEPQPRVKPHCRAPSGKEWDAASGAWADKKAPHVGPRANVGPQSQPAAPSRFATRASLIAKVVPKRYAPPPPPPQPQLSTPACAAAPAAPSSSAARAIRPAAAERLAPASLPAATSSARALVPVTASPALLLSTPASTTPAAATSVQMARAVRSALNARVLGYHAATPADASLGLEAAEGGAMEQGEEAEAALTELLHATLSVLLVGPRGVGKARMVRRVLAKLRTEAAEQHAGFQ
ncbi:hypothetical protein T492DRAFT_863771, partial [Pavlovales sp. CCMP2436]